jgi:hypothetical protein
MQTEWTPTMDRLNDILDAYAASTPGPNFETLKEWVRRYPEFEAELTEFTIDWRLLHAFSPDAQATVDEETLVLRGMSIVERLLYTKRMQATEEKARENGVARGEMPLPLSSLIRAANERSMTLDTFAHETGLSVGLIAALNNRLVRVASIPREAVEAVARVLGRSIDAVFVYLQLPPTLSTTAQYEAERSPTAAPQRDFFELVRIDRELTEEQKQRWLVLDPKKG